MTVLPVAGVWGRHVLLLRMLVPEEMAPLGTRPWHALDGWQEAEQGAECCALALLGSSTLKPLCLPGGTDPHRTLPGRWCLSGARGRSWPGTGGRGSEQRQPVLEGSELGRRGECCRGRDRTRSGSDRDGQAETEGRGVALRCDVGSGHLQTP